MYSKNKIDDIYIIESMQTERLQRLEKYWEEEDTPYSGDFNFWPDFFKYYNKTDLCEYIESSYIMWKLEQHQLAPKYDVLRSLVPL